MMRCQKNELNRCSNNNKGFTLVELVVVLVLIVILTSLAIFGGLAWQDWSRFKHENTVAEDIFFAAQNQITELDANGTLERKMSVLKVNGEYKPEYVLGSNNIENLPDGQLYFDITDENGTTLSWNNIWATDSGANKNLNTEKRTILRLTAKENQYDLYLKKKSGEDVSEDDLSKGTILLFDLIAQYLPDTSVLNGSIAVEFSPEAGQVLAVCFSDRTGSFTYGSGDGTRQLVSILDRTEKYRRDNMVGYFSAGILAEKIKGRSTADTNIKLLIKNSNQLIFTVDDPDSEIGEDDVMTFTLKDGSTTAGNDLMSFTFTKSEVTATDISGAVSNPVAVNANFTGHQNAGHFKDWKNVKFKIPVYIYAGKMYLIMDAADVQAATAAYNVMLHSSEQDSYNNTFSFTRFGFPETVDYIYATLAVADHSVISCHDETSDTNTDESLSNNHEGYINEDSGKYGECVLFASSKADGSNNEITIRNGRHFYNMRYLTEYKEERSVSTSHVFKLTRNIDWNAFTGTGGGDGYNNFLNSDSYSEASGIDNRVYQKVTVDGKSVYPFPSFRCLGYGDTFTQDAEYGTNGHYVISNLTITFANNLRCGVYDDVATQYGNVSSTVKTCANALRTNPSDAYTNYAGILGVSSVTNDSTGSNAARGGALPLGLFAENLGTISNISLNKHVVQGVMDASGTNNDAIVCTNMVGGFTGNNMGTLENLRLLDHVEDNNPDSAKANISHVNGRTDVGGILGRQSFKAGSPEDRGVTVSNIYNYATVSGFENVGGIAGRVYTHYVGDERLKNTAASSLHSHYDFNGEKNDPQYKNYHDGYFITDKNYSMTGYPVVRADLITISNCHNRGEVYGDTAFTGKRSFIGGIAGATIDGYMNTNNSGQLITEYQGWGYFDGNFKYVSVEKCDSFVKRNDLDAVKTYVNAHVGDTENGDFYVGGLVGYAKLTSFKECNNEPENTFKDTTGAPVCYVIGNRYVGGIAGCADMVHFEKTNTLTYAVTNYNNVVGKKYVGGIAGAFGIGVTKHAELSFRNPSENAASLPAQYSDDGNKNVNSGKNITGNYMLNTAVVLALKNETENFKGTLEGEESFNGCVGGIAGVTRTSIANGDNIQPENVKKLAWKLVTGEQIDSASIKNYTANEIVNKTANSYFGGNYVGGIVGYVFARGHVNPLAANQQSKVDALIFGENVVGGVVGTAYRKETADENVWKQVRNCYTVVADSGSSGAIVIGRDAVGGLIGDLFSMKFDWTGTVKSPKVGFVAGRYAVGGLVGVKELYFRNSLVNNADMNLTTGPTLEGNVFVRGIALVGGVVGLQEYGETRLIQTKISSDSKKAKLYVTGDYFAGGIYGGLVCNFDNDTHDENNNELQQYTSLNNVEVQVTANAAFAGGISGLYGNPNPATYNAGSFTRDNSVLHNALKSCLSGEDSGYGKFISLSADDWGGRNQDKNNVKFSTNANAVYSRGSVEAPFFVGGAFGFVPECTNAEVKNFKTKCKLKVTSSIGDNNAEKYSYLGGVTGLIPSGMTISNCTNEMLNQEDGYVPSDGSFVGGLAEVNNGKIENCTNNIEMQRYGNYTGCVAPFCGVNYGTIQNCTNNKQIISGGSSAGITCVTGANSILFNCVNAGEIGWWKENISESGNASGIVLIARGNGTKGIQSCVNGGQVKGKNAAGIIAIVDCPEGNTDSNENGTVNIVNTYNNAKIIGAENSGGMIACANSGIVNIKKVISTGDGVTEATQAEQKAIVENKAEIICANSNDYSSDKPALTVYSGNAGGLIGYSAASAVTLERVSNSGAVKAANAGGFVGRIEKGSLVIANSVTDTSDLNSAISAATNTGSVLGTANAAGVLGIAQKADENDDITVYIDNSVNMGPVQTRVADGNEGKATGISVDTANGTIQNSRNYASLSYIDGDGNAQPVTQYGITCAVTQRLYGNLVANGLTEGTSENPLHPIAPDDGAHSTTVDSEHIRNFYIAGEQSVISDPPVASNTNSTDGQTNGGSTDGQTNGGSTDGQTNGNTQGESAGSGQTANGLVQLAINPDSFSIDVPDEMINQKYIYWGENTSQPIFNSYIKGLMQEQIKAWGTDVDAELMYMRVRFFAGSETDTYNYFDRLFAAYCYYRYNSDNSFTPEVVQSNNQYGDFMNYAKAVIAKNSLEAQGDDYLITINVDTGAAAYNPSEEVMNTTDPNKWGQKVYDVYMNSNYLGYSFNTDLITINATANPDIIYFYYKYFNNVDAFRAFMAKVFVQYYVDHNGEIPTDTTVLANEIINVATVVIGSGGEPVIPDTDNSHWPVQLYKNDFDLSDSKNLKYKLLYNRWDKYFDSGIETFAMEPTAEAIAEQIALSNYQIINDFDAKYMVMVKDETNHPNYSKKGEAPQGFVKKPEALLTAGRRGAKSSRNYVLMGGYDSSGLGFISDAIANIEKKAEEEKKKAEEDKKGGKKPDANTETAPVQEEENPDGEKQEQTEEGTGEKESGEGQENTENEPAGEQENTDNTTPSEGQDLPDGNESSEENPDSEEEKKEDEQAGEESQENQAGDEQQQNNEETRETNQTEENNG